MRPIICTIFNIHIYAYGLMLAIAFLVSTLYVINKAKHKGISKEVILDLAIFICLGAIIGARLLYILLDWQKYAKDILSIFFTWDGGLSFHGGFIGGLVAGIWYLKRKKYSPWEFADIIAPCLPIGYSIARVGCFLAGDCYGIPYGDGRHFNIFFGWICSVQDWTNYYQHWSFLYRYPTQIYAIIFNLLIFYLLFRQRNHKNFPGYLMFLYVLYYSIYRFIVEIVRDSQIILFGWLRTAQLASVIIAILSIFAIIYLNKRYHKKQVMCAENGDTNISS